MRGTTLRTWVASTICRMGLPLLKEFLPEDLGAPFEPPPAVAVLDEKELPLAEHRARQLQVAMEEFVSTLRSSFAQLAEEDVEYAFHQVADLEGRQRAQLDRCSGGIQQLRSQTLEWPDAPRKTQRLSLLERQLQLYKAILTTYQWGKDQLESLRDAVLVREAREFSARAFWGDDDD